MRGDDGTADRQSEAEAVRFGGEKPFEGAFGAALGQAVTDISDLDAQTTILFGTGDEREVAVIIFVRGHGIAGVHDQIEQHLLELHPVATDGREVGCQAGRHHHSVVGQVAADKFQHLQHDVVGIEQLPLDLAFGQQQAQVPDDFAVFGSNGELLGRQSLKGTPPRLRAGENRMELVCPSAPEPAPRVKVSVFSQGEEI